MKTLFFIFLSFVAPLKSFCTEQVCDTLFYGRDTILLLSFPMQDLRFTVAHFTYGNIAFPNTGCWRGYIATWQIRNDSLFLVRITSCDAKNFPPRREKNIADLFRENNTGFPPAGNMIFASWYTSDLVRFEAGPYGGNVTKDYPGRTRRIHLDKADKKHTHIFLRFDRGVITQSNSSKLH
jgi:hypothetical protein